AVEVTVVIAVSSDEAAPADPIERLDALDYMDRKRQPRNPRRAGKLVGKIEARRRGIAEARFCAKVVSGAAKKMWFLSAHQVDVAKRLRGLGRQRRRPDQAGGAVAKEVGCLDVAEVVDSREDGQQARLSPRVSGAVEADDDAVLAEVEQVR